MGLLSQSVERNEIAAGDHIYTWRALYAYSHHGIYLDGNKVVHFTGDQVIDSSGDSSVKSSGSTPGYPFSFSASCSQVPPTTCSNISECGSRQPESGVILSCLDCFLSTGSLYRFEYGVSAAIYIAKFRGGTCTTAKSDPAQEVIHRTKYLLLNGFGNYDVFRNNCEDFALYCKTGLLVVNQRGPGRSGQAACLTSVPAAIFSSLKFFISSPVTPVGMVTTTAGMYCMNRYGADIGVRTDVVKVKAEDMVLFHGRNGHTEPNCKEREKDCGYFGWVDEFLNRATDVINEARNEANNLQLEISKKEDLLSKSKHRNSTLKQEIERLKLESIRLKSENKKYEWKEKIYLGLLVVLGILNGLFVYLMTSDKKRQLILP